MAWTVLLLSDQVSDARDLLPSLPMGPWRIVVASLKAHEPRDLIPIHPDVLLIDATGDVENAEEAARGLTTAWEIGLPPVIAVVNEDTVARFRWELGTDDFFLNTAPASEISARLEIAARRSGRGDDPLVLKVGDVTVNPENYQVYVRGRPLDLTFKEFELLKFLAQRPGRVRDRDLLLREVWGYDYYGGTRTVDVHIRRLRAKLGAEHEALIETIRNVGYRLVPRPRETLMLFIIGLVLSVLFLDWPWQLVVLIPLALVELLEIALWLRLRGVPDKSGAVMLLGREAEVVADCAPTGQVRVAGQIWSATADVPALKYSKVIVTGIEGIRLQVTPQSTSG